MKTIFIQYSLLLISTIAYTQTVDPIRTIKQEFKLINENIEHMEISKSMNFDMATDGTEIITYSDNNSLRKLVLKHAGETGKLVEEYYLKDNELIFYFNQHYSYNMPYYIDSIKAVELGFQEWHNPDMTTVDENRYYFWNNELIRWIDNEGDNISKNSDEFKKSEMKIFQNLKDIRKIIKR